MFVAAIAPERLVGMRHALLRPEWPIADVRYPTDHAPGTFHLAAYEADPAAAEPIGCASAHVDPLPDEEGLAYRLRGMAVVEAHRSRGVGGVLLGAIEQGARERGARWLWCNGRTRAGDFYRRHGWMPRGELFDLGGIPHLIFVKPLA